MSAPNTSAPKLSAFNESNKLSTSKHRMWKSFLLGHNSKLPAKDGEWNIVNRYKWKLRSFEFIREKNINKTGINFGIPCGLVNKCFVLDMDLYKLKGDSEFIKRFGEDYIEYFNTLTIKTGSGGEHLYFNYDNDIKTTTCKLHEIDIRSNGSYAVAPGSCIWSPQQIKEYKVIRDTPMITVPAELKEWILSNLYRHSRKVTDKVIKDKNGEILNPVCKSQLSYQNEVDLSVYTYAFSDTILRKIFDTIDNCFYEDYDDFLIVATCLKTLNKREYFEEICNTKLDKKHLKSSSSWGIHSEDMWDSCEYKNVNTLPFILRESGFMEETLDPAIVKANEKYNTQKIYTNARTEYYKSINNFKNVDTPLTHDNWFKKNEPVLYELVKDCILYNDTMTKAIKDFMGYYMYKPTNNHTTKPDKIITGQRYLDGDTPGSFIQQFQSENIAHSDLPPKLVIVKSDTGTGKTTAVKNYFKLHPEKCFVSIVSRLSLGKEQTAVFKKADIECYWFRDEVQDLWRMEGCNLVIQVDSLNKLASWCEDSWNAYTIYLDEFNSLIEYFIDCPNLDDKRITVKRMLERIIIGAEQVIMTDAHISDTSLLFLKQLGIKAPQIYVENDYKHNGKNGGINTREVYCNEDLLLELQDKMKNDLPFMICCDSKNVCDVIHHELGRNPDIGIFTSETMEDIDLDKWKWVIFSPKIVYGLDSVMERPVYCVMKEHTISPLAMIQQANRCRNITELVYYFGRKSHGLYKYENKEEVLDMLNNVENNADATALASAELLCGEEETKKYKELLAHHMYIMDCFNTNKFGHFLNLLRGQGFNVDIHRETTSNTLQQKSKEVKKYKQDALKEMFKDEEERIQEWTKNNINEIRGYLQEEKQSLENSLQTYMDCEDIEEKRKNNTLHNSQKEQLSNYNMEIKECADLLSLYGSGEKGDLWLAKNKDELIDDSVYPKYIQNNIKLLNIQPDKVGDYEKILIDNHQITNHFRIVKFFFKEESDTLKKLEEKKDYNCKKGASSDFKILYLKKVLKTLGVEGYSLTPDCSAMTQDKSEKLLDEYRVVFTDRNKKKKISFEEEKGAQQLIVKMYKNIFGADIIKGKKSTKTTDEGVKSVTTYNLNMDKIMQSQDIYTESNKAFMDCGVIQKSKLYSKIEY